MVFASAWCNQERCVALSWVPESGGFKQIHVRLSDIRANDYLFFLPERKYVDFCKRLRTSANLELDERIF